MKLLIPILLLILSLHTFAQDGQRSRAEVLDYGQLYSTYSWEEPVIRELKTKMGDVMAAQIMKASVESAWPEGIAGLDGREANRPLMGQYVVYYLTTVDENKAVLYVPKAENLGMPANMRPADDIFFLVTSSVVVLGEGKTITGEPITSATTTPVVYGDFASELNMIAADFKDYFAGILGEQVMLDEEGLESVYTCNATLEGSEAMFLADDVISGEISFFCSFPGSDDKTIAIENYRALIRKIASVKLSCCQLEKQEEFVDEAYFSQSFRDPVSRSGMPDFPRNMIIELSVEQGEEFDDMGELLPVWYTLMSIYAE